MYSQVIHIFVGIAFAALATADPSKDLDLSYYCSDDLSCNGIPNAMCNKKTEFGPNCRNPEYIPMDEVLRRTILTRHNSQRNVLALGGSDDFKRPQAADMATMQWDDELELMSLTTALQCKMAHDECFRTANYKHGGQNVYEKCYKPDELPFPSDIAKVGVHSWIDEYSNISDISIEHFVDNDTIARIGRYLQVVKNNADRIGCSIVQYSNYANLVCSLFVCNYNVGNKIDYPTYEIGPIASKCSTGTSRQYPGLCSETEDFTKHKYAEVFFKNESPVVAEWLKRNKRIQPGGFTIYYQEKQNRSASEWVIV